MSTGLMANRTFEALTLKLNLAYGKHLEPCLGSATTRHKQNP